MSLDLHKLLDALGPELEVELASIIVKRRLPRSICPQCGTPFQTSGGRINGFKRSKSIYCSGKCRTYACRARQRLLTGLSAADKPADADDTRPLTRS
jgi:hypothetical protein